MIRELLQAILGLETPGPGTPGLNETKDAGGEPRLPMINPCPPGYVLKDVGGSFQCVLEDLQQLDNTALRRFLVNEEENGWRIGEKSRINPATPVSPLTIGDRSGSLG